MELVSAFRAADVLVLPSDQENWAVVVQEAMSAGLVVVASNVVGAAHELVADGVNGRIFLRGDCESLRQSIEDVTRPNRLSDLKSNVTTAIRQYRETVNPVAEIRRALSDVDVLSSAPTGKLP
jgi:glycosyltransferase involved in cell wall biosynthesis